MNAQYGYCPTCAKPGRERERRPDGNDTCEDGHVYPSAEALRLDREPKLVPPDYRMKVQATDGMLRAEILRQFQEMVNRLAKKGCTFFQVDENEERSVAIVSGWLKQPRQPDLPYVDRSELVVDQVPA